MESSAATQALLRATRPGVNEPAGAGPVSLVCAGASHVGLMRENNEDLFHCDARRGLLIVIDGLGGHAGGEYAARIALEQMLLRLEREAGSVEERLREALTLANNAICEAAQARPELRGMGCVATVAVVEAGLVTVGHVGDTRLYRWAGGRLAKLTCDHAPVGEMEDACTITELEAMQHPRRHEISRNLGQQLREPDEPDFVELIQETCTAGDGLLLCSDGLSDLVTSAQMAAVIGRSVTDPQRVVTELISQALAEGGKDNVTVVFAYGANEFPTAEALRVVTENRLGATRDDLAPSVTPRTSPRWRRWGRRVLYLLAWAGWTWAAFWLGKHWAEWWQLVLCKLSS